MRGLLVELSFLDFLRQSGSRSGFVGGLGFVVGTFVLLGRGCEVAVFEHGQQLAFSHLAATLDVESFDRRTDLGSDCRLLQREQNGLGGNRALHGFLFYRDYLHRDCGFLLCGIAGAGRQEK